MVHNVVTHLSPYDNLRETICWEVTQISWCLFPLIPFSGLKFFCVCVFCFSISIDTIAVTFWLEGTVQTGFICAPHPIYCHFFFLICGMYPFLMTYLRLFLTSFYYKCPVNFLVPKAWCNFKRMLCSICIRLDFINWYYVSSNKLVVIYGRFLRKNLFGLVVLT